MKYPDNCFADNFYDILSVMSQSQVVGVRISQDGKMIKSMEVGVSHESGLGDLIDKLRQVQGDTNEYLTQLISENGNSVGDQGDEEEDDAEDDSDEEIVGPDNKVPKLQ